MTAQLVQFELGPEWSTESVDICWLDCSEPGFLLQLEGPGYEIVCCARHARELEAAKGESTYALADPPKSQSGKEWWPWLPLADRWTHQAA